MENVITRIYNFFHTKNGLTPCGRNIHKFKRLKKSIYDCNYQCKRCGLLKAGE